MFSIYTRLLSFMTGLSLFAVFAVVLVASLSRYLFNMPIQWSEEVAKYAMIYGAMFGMTLCYLNNSHIRFTLLESLTPKVHHRWIYLTHDGIALVSGAILSWSGYLFMMKRGALIATGTGLPMYYFQSAMVVGGATLTLAALIKIVRHFTHPEQGE
ncbi:TRAP transporter small permease [Oceanobacter mangrovi]|uniref:TRAP transporter small permease n=1 Tax=Oceanobacter mangrovi TaxID=2862510 RepID=UPI001C8DE5F1|nr:TRAP transporter small permease [Oceanobacter mangrovi]